MDSKAPSTFSMRTVHQVRLFFIALQFFTRLPIPRWVGFEASWLHQSSRYFPAVGVVVGAVTATIYAVAALVVPALVAVLLSTVAGILLTGAFHEDGFADVCDGFGGGMTRTRVLDIMTDSRVGAYGAIGIGLLLALKCAALSYLSAPLVVASLLAAHPLSRLAATTLIWKLDYAKGEGKAKPLAEQISNTEFTIAATTAFLVFAILCFLGVLPVNSLFAGLLAMTAATWWMARRFVARIGGYTGDCLGATQQVAEVAFYLAVLASVR